MPLISFSTIAFSSSVSVSSEQVEKLPVTGADQVLQGLAAGVQAIVVPKDNAARITATVRKVAVGAAESVPLVQVTNLARTMKHLQKMGVWIIGTAGETDTCLYDVKLSGEKPMALDLTPDGRNYNKKAIGAFNVKSYDNANQIVTTTNPITAPLRRTKRTATS